MRDMVLIRIQHEDAHDKMRNKERYCSLIAGRAKNTNVGTAEQTTNEKGS